MAKKKFIVTHPKLYMRSNGKLVHVETGAEISMEEKEASSLLKQNKLLAVGAKKSVKVGDDQEQSDPKAK